MTPQMAATIAVELYGGSPAAYYAVLEAVNGPTPEHRQRAALALAMLDPDSPINDPVAHQRVANLLQRLYTEAQRQARAA